jgi:hypothetical protein
MHITLAAADISQLDTMDAYLEYRGVSVFNQGLQVFSAFLFLFIEGLQFFEGKKRYHILIESMNTNTHVYSVCWFIWRQAKKFINVIDDFININTLFIEEFSTLEKSKFKHQLKLNKHFPCQLDG